MQTYKNDLYVLHNLKNVQPLESNFTELSESDV